MYFNKSLNCHLKSKNVIVSLLQLLLKKVLKSLVINYQTIFIHIYLLRIVYSFGKLLINKYMAIKIKSNEQEMENQGVLVWK